MSSFAIDAHEANGALLVEGRVDLGLRWRASTFSALGQRFSRPVNARPLTNPYLVAASGDVANLIGMDPARFTEPRVLQALAGSQEILGTTPVASVYSGHQFGVWAGQLGDGRALLLGEVSVSGEPSGGLELQFKGAGPTPYSRMGDGRAVLRSSIREFLCSEAMHALGIPTTRALCVVGSDDPVRRETMETAAVVTRVAESFIRFGHFEHFAAKGEDDALKTLADYVIDRHYPQCRDTDAFAGNAYAALVNAVSVRTADLMAQWQAVGFCHGVMNTDNMSILGLTIDYGPFQFLDGFNPAHICNHSDSQGRYACNQQPNVAYWNLFCLAQALMPLIGDENLALAALEPYRERFSKAYQRRMRAKLGFALPRPGDGPLIEDLMQLLAKERVDWTIFWRRLSHHAAEGASPEPVRDLFVDRAGFDAWLLRYRELIALEGQSLDANLMLNSNPAYVLRNHLGEEAIQAAKTGDFEPLHRLQAVLAAPFAEQPGADHYADFPPDWASSIEISCSS
jgi:uncharacterized protein YdiU (UPF0061 family)